MATASKLNLAVLTGDPRLPYEYGVDGQFSGEELEAVHKAESALKALDGYQITMLDDHERMIDTLRAERPDLVLNFCDTGYANRLRNEINVPALLDLLDLPYTGAGPVSMGLCGDKALVRHLCIAHGIPVPNEKLVDLRADPLDHPDLYPAIIKPNAGCGSIGVTPDCVVHDAAAADAYLRRLAEDTDRPRALIQDFLDGPEYTLGLVGNPATGFTILPTLEIDYSALPKDLPPILSYGSKVDPDSPYWQALQFKRAELPEDVHARMVEQAVFLFERLSLRDYARIDFRAGADGLPRMIDANFNPTWSHDGKMALMAQWAGYDYGQFLALILETARARYAI